MRWYERKPEKLRAEATQVSARFPDLRAAIRSKGYEVMPGARLRKEEVVIEGLCPLDPDIQDTCPCYEIVIVLPDRYPMQVPSLYCKDPSLIRDVDRHILPDGWACLCVRSEYRRFLSREYNLVEFIEQLVVPFLVGQFSYDVEGVWPWTERAHGCKGIEAAWRELIGFGDGEVALSFLSAMSRKGGYAGHLPCPCGGGSKLRNCHSELFRELKKVVNWADAKADLDLIRSAK